MDDHSPTTERNCRVSLELICWSYRNATLETSYLVNDYLQLLHHVCSILPLNIGEELTFYCFTFLRLLLNMTADNGDGRVLGVLLSTTDVLDKMQAYLRANADRKIQCACLDLLSDLIHHQPRFQIQATYRLSLDFMVIEWLLASEHLDENVSGLYCLTALLQTSLQPEMATIQWITAEPVVETLRSLNFTLQNVTARDEDTLQDKAFQVLYQLHNYARHHQKQLEHYMLDQPWTAVLFELKVNQLLTAELSSPILKYFLLFVESPDCSKPFGEFLDWLFVNQIMNAPVLEAADRSTVRFILAKVLTSNYKHKISPATKAFVEEHIQEKN